MYIDPSACAYLTVTLIAPLAVSDGPKGVKGQLKRIKTRPDGPGQMGLTDLYPWAEEKASPSLI